MTRSLHIVMAGAVVLCLATGWKSNSQTAGHDIDDIDITTAVVKAHIHREGGMVNGKGGLLNDR